MTSVGNATPATYFTQQPASQTAQQTGQQQTAAASSSGTSGAPGGAAKSGGSGASSGSSSSSSTTIKSETTKTNADGSVTTTITYENGSVKTATSAPDSHAASDSYRRQHNGDQASQVDKLA